MVRLLEAAFHESVVPIVCSNEHQFIFWNNAFSELTGYTEKQLAASSFNELFVRDTGDNVHQAIYQKTIDKGFFEVIEGKIMVQNKEIIDTIVHTTAFPHERETFLLSYVRDRRLITLQEQLAYENTQRLKMAIQATKQGLWDWNSQTDATYYSDEYFLMLGYQPNEFTPSYDKWVSLLHPDDRGIAIASQNLYLEDKKDSYRIEFRLKKKDGSYLWTHTEARIVERNEAGKAVRIIGIVVNIDEKKKLELQLKRQNQKLIDYSFFNSHRLRSPIATLSGMLQLLKEEYDPSYLNHLQVCVNQLDSITKEINEILNEQEEEQAIEGLKNPVKKISLIDDDRIFHIVYKKTLERYDNTLVTDAYEKARVVLEKIRQHTLETDMILLDINMKGMSGWEFLEEFQKLKSKVPVYILTSSTDIHDIQKAKEYSVVKGFIMKPLTQQILADILPNGSQQA
ncbi:MAG: PAS domain-containing protein [Thermonemataceae bacterium]|mgnify:CR=1 FL=1